MEVDPIEVVRGIYEAGNRRDRAAAAALIDPEVEVRYEGVLPELHGKTLRGFEGVATVQQTVTAELEDFEAHPESIEMHGDRVLAVVHQRGRGRASGIDVERRLAQAWTVRGGRAVRWEIFRDLDHALEVLDEVE